MDTLHPRIDLVIPEVLHYMQRYDLFMLKPVRKTNKYYKGVVSRRLRQQSKRCQQCCLNCGLMSLLSAGGSKLAFLILALLHLQTASIFRA
jgi:hypothetical protein